METDTQNFCTCCGHILTEGARFCPECGTRVPGRNPEAVAQERQEIKDAAGVHLRWASYLMLIYSIPFLIIGIAVFIQTDALVDAIVSTEEFSDYTGLTEADVNKYIHVVGFAYVLSSICGIVSAYMCWKRRNYWVALILCILSVFTGAAGFFALFMGLFAFWIILSGRLGFQEYEEQLDAELQKIQ